MCLRSDDPADPGGVPCLLHAYAPVVVASNGGGGDDGARRRQSKRRGRSSPEWVEEGILAADAAVTDGTLTRILPPAEASWEVDEEEEKEEHDDSGNSRDEKKVTATPSTMMVDFVRMDPNGSASSSSLLSSLSGELPLPRSDCNDHDDDDVLSARDPEAVEEVGDQVSGLRGCRRPK